MDAPAISTLDDEESPPPIFRNADTAGPSAPRIRVKLRIPSAMTASSKRSEEGDSDEEMVDELADDDDAASSSAHGGVGPHPPLQHSSKPSSTRGGKGSRGPRKKRPAQIGERVMSPPPRTIGAEWVVHVSQEQPLPGSDDARSEASAAPTRGRGRGSRGGKRGVPGPGRGWRKGITNAKKAAWEAEHAALNDITTTPEAFASSIPPASRAGSGSGSALFREYYPPSDDISPPSIPVPPLLQVKEQPDRPPKYPPSSSAAALGVSSRSTSSPYPPPIMQPTLPNQELRYLPPEPKLEPGMAPTDHRGGIVMPRHGIPSRPFPVAQPPKLAAQPPQAVAQPIDKAGKKFKVRKWQNVSREIKGIGGSRWFVKTWLGGPDSEYARHRTMSVPTVGPLPTFSARFRFKQEFNVSAGGTATGTGSPMDRGTPMEGTAQNPVIVDLTDDVDMESSPAPQMEGAIAVPQM